MNKEIIEILNGVRDGKYRMVASKMAPLERLTANGEWVTLSKFHHNTIKAAQRRMKFRFDEVKLMGFYELAVDDIKIEIK